MKTREERVFQVVSHVIMILASAACIVPFLLLIISSLPIITPLYKTAILSFRKSGG